MTEIQEISPQKRKKDRYNIYTDDGFLMSLSAETIVREKLKEGSVLSDETIARLKEEDTYVYAKELAANYLSYSPRTKKRLTDYLTGKGIDRQTAERAAELMERYGYIDDGAYAREMIRCYSSKLGKRAIRNKLLQNGVESALADAALEQLPEEDERESAQRLVEKLREKYKDLPPRSRINVFMGRSCERVFCTPRLASFSIRTRTVTDRKERIGIPRRVCRENK